MDESKLVCLKDYIFYQQYLHSAGIKLMKMPKGTDEQGNPVEESAAEPAIWIHLFTPQGLKQVTFKGDSVIETVQLWGALLQQLGRLPDEISVILQELSEKYVPEAPQESPGRIELRIDK